MLRRTLMQQTGLIGLGMLAKPIASLAQERGDLRFQVFRDDSEIGHHVLSFTKNGDQLTVDIEIELRVSIAFITVYSYSHRNREEWDGGRLIGFSSQTNDNGTEHSVDAWREGDRLIVDGSAGRTTAPPDAMPATYWHGRFLDLPTWINTQNGKIIEAKVEAEQSERIAGADGIIDAMRFQVTGDIDADIWYDDERWVKLAFDGPDGSRIDYRLAEDSVYGWLSYVPGKMSKS